MTDPKKTLAAMVFTLGALALGVFGIWFALKSSLQEPEIDQAVGAIATVAFALVAVAFIRRSLARLPPLVAGFFTGVNAWDAFFVENEPSAVPLSGYLFCNAILIFVAGLALPVLTVDLIPRQSAEEQR